MRATKAIVLLLVFCVSQLYVSASLTEQGTQAQTASTPAVPMIGRLEVHGGRYITVDNNDLESGSTILDGQTLETTKCKSATIHLLPVGVITPAVKEIGAIELATNTKALINYSAGNVKVTLIRGWSSVEMAPAIDTKINTPDGVSTPAIQRNPSDLKRAEVRFPSNAKEDYRPACVAPIVFGVAGAAAAITTLAIVLPCRPSSDTSPTTPGQCP
jgi:ribosomal protein L2